MFFGKLSIEIEQSIIVTEVDPMAIDALTQSGALFAGSLYAAPSAEEVEGEAAVASGTTITSTDKVTISEEARNLSMQNTLKDTDDTEDTEEQQRDQLIDQLKKRIEELEQEIKAIEDSTMPREKKDQEIQARQNQLMEMRDQLVKAQMEKLEASGYTEGGGTRAQGVGNSVASF